MDTFKKYVKQIKFATTAEIAIAAALIIMKNAQGLQNALTVTKTNPRTHTTLSIEDAVYLKSNKNSLPL